MAQWRAATRAAKAMGIRLRPSALFWVQGESDSSKIRRKWYDNRLKQTIAAMREDFDAVDLPAFIAVNPHFGAGKNEGMPEIVRIQQAFAAADPFTVYVDTSEATTANAAHFDAAGTLLVGERFASALAQFELNQTTANASP